MKTQAVTFRIENDYLEDLKIRAKAMSIFEGKEISYTDLIRQALYLTFPPSNQSFNELFLVASGLCNG